MGVVVDLASQAASSDEGAEEECAEEEQRLGISFFGDDEDAACKRVWDIYMRDSVERGFEEDTKKRGELAPHLAAIQPNEEERPMTTTNTNGGGLTAREQLALDAYRALKSALGREPSNPELADKMGIKGTDGAKSQAAYVLRAVLVKKGLAATAPRGGRREPRGTVAKTKAPASISPPATNGARRPRAPRTLEGLANGLSQQANGHAKPAAASVGGDDDLLAGLISRRDFHADKVAAFTIAIEALGGKVGEA